jgi:hypothetical protein
MWLNALATRAPDRYPCTVSLEEVTGSVRSSRIPSTCVEEAESADVEGLDGVGHLAGDRLGRADVEGVVLDLEGETSASSSARWVPHDADRGPGGSVACASGTVTSMSACAV